MQREMGTASKSLEKMRRAKRQGKLPLVPRPMGKDVGSECGGFDLNVFNCSSFASFEASKDAALAETEAPLLHDQPPPPPL